MRRTTISTLVTDTGAAQPRDVPREFAQVLALLSHAEGEAELTLGSTHMPLSRETVDLLRSVFSAVAEGGDVILLQADRGAASALAIALAQFETVAGDAATMSSQEAADVLNVSRPFVVKLARSGELPHTKVGNRHRFAAADVADYAERMRSKREDALRELVPEGGYAASDF